MTHSSNSKSKYQIMIFALQKNISCVLCVDVIVNIYSIHFIFTFGERHACNCLPNIMQHITMAQFEQCVREKQAKRT